MNQVAQEIDRRKSNTARILEYLKENGVATNSQLNRIGGFRYGARLFELRGEGHIIVRNHIKDGLFEYVYKGNRDEIIRKNKNREYEEGHD